MTVCGLDVVMYPWEDPFLLSSYLLPAAFGILILSTVVLAVVAVIQFRKNKKRDQTDDQGEKSPQI